MKCLSFIPLAAAVNLRSGGSTAAPVDYFKEIKERNWKPLSQELNVAAKKPDYDKFRNEYEETEKYLLDKIEKYEQKIADMDQKLAVIKNRIKMREYSDTVGNDQEGTNRFQDHARDGQDIVQVRVWEGTQPESDIKGIVGFQLVYLQDDGKLKEDTFRRVRNIGLLQAPVGMLTEDKAAMTQSLADYNKELQDINEDWKCVVLQLDVRKKDPKTGLPAPEYIAMVSGQALRGPGGLVHRVAFSTNVGRSIEAGGAEHEDDIDWDFKIYNRINKKFAKITGFAGEFGEHRLQWLQIRWDEEDLSDLWAEIAKAVADKKQKGLEAIKKIREALDILDELKLFLDARERTWKQFMLLVELIDVDRAKVNQKIHDMDDEEDWDFDLKIKAVEQRESTGYLQN